MNRIRLALHRLFRRPATTKPMRLYTRRVPDGVYLDLEEYFTHVVTAIADDEDALALLMEIIDDRSVSREHNGWEPEKLLMEHLALKVGYEVPVRGEALARLAKRLEAAVPKPVVIPAQRREGGAAV
ncbi:hypothetical protein [Streptomyces cupreus]|uniref:Uncharacterized protein n=1 Tax=Streptomyces cupreus TaxID=2759956 RepID=A0A7X1M9F1_9ACTN|nr:hypothetical protein [Streptomyces cupreus]MBC2903204.1 hypothetical protein [Streptomyces cupreus]